MATNEQIIEKFTVFGYILEGAISEIPALWTKLNEALAEQKIYPEESFGVTLCMQNGTIRYIAGVSDERAKALPNVDQVIVPGGKYIYSAVHGGVENIPITFDVLGKQPNVQIRHSSCFERYVHPEGSTGYETEAWVPIE